MPDEELPAVVVETDLQRALDYQPDAVIIANPTAMHLDIAIPFAKSGSSILLEKPISNNLERIEELRLAEKQGGGRILVGFQFRYHPGLIKAAEWIKDGAIGRPLSVHCEWGEYLPGWHPWEDYRKSYSAREDLGGGVVLTLCHPLDYLRWLMGEVSELWAFTGKVSDLEMGVEDVAEIGLHFANGAVGNLHLDYFRRPGEHRFEIIGTGGMIEWRTATGAARLYRATSEGWETFLPPQGFERNNLFIAEMKHFLDVVEKKNEPICTLEDGVRALQLALAVHESGKTKKLVQL
jgi:predicted dehydrogenase